MSSVKTPKKNIGLLIIKPSSIGVHCTGFSSLFGIVWEDLKCPLAVVGYWDGLWHSVCHIVGVLLTCRKGISQQSVIGTTINKPVEPICNDWQALAAAQMSHEQNNPVDSLLYRISKTWLTGDYELTHNFGLSTLGWDRVIFDGPDDFTQKLRSLSDKHRRCRQRMTTGISTRKIVIWLRKRVVGEHHAVLGEDSCETKNGRVFWHVREHRRVDFNEQKIDFNE